jgi:type III secretion protein J
MNIRRAISGWLLSVLLVACGNKVELLHEISEVEANDVLAALLDAGITADKQPGKDGMVSLSVEQAHFSRAISLLNAEGLPHEKYVKMGDVFRKEGMISSPLEERARYLWALSQELSATVSQIDGVIKARVHVVLPERSNGADPATPSSAAVFIKHKPGFNYDDVIPQVKRLVSNSIPGLIQEKVTVVMLPSLERIGTEESRARQIAPQKTGPAMSAGEHDAQEKRWEPILIWGACIALLAFLGGVAVWVWKHWGVDKQMPQRPTTASSSASATGIRASNTTASDGPASSPSPDGE